MPTSQSKRNPPAGFDFDREQAAHHVGCSVATLHDWAHKRIGLPYVIAGGKAWYRRSDCDYLLAKRERKIDRLLQKGERKISAA